MLEVINLPVDRLNRWLPVKRPERRASGGTALRDAVRVGGNALLDPDPRRHRGHSRHDGQCTEGRSLLFVYGIGKGVPLLLLGVASGSLVFMRSVSKVTPALTKIGGVGIIGAGAYLVWIA